MYNDLVVLIFNRVESELVERALEYAVEHKLIFNRVERDLQFSAYCHLTLFMLIFNRVERTIIGPVIYFHLVVDLQ